MTQVKIIEGFPGSAEGLTNRFLQENPDIEVLRISHSSELDPRGFTSLTVMIVYKPKSEHQSTGPK